MTAKDTLRTRCGAVDRPALEERRDGSYETLALLRAVEAIATVWGRDAERRRDLLHRHVLAHRLINGAGDARCKREESIGERAGGRIDQLRRRIDGLETASAAVAPLTPLLPLRAGPEAGRDDLPLMTEAGDGRGRG